MFRPSVSRLIAAPVPEVWKLLVTVEDWPRWGPSIRGAQCDTPVIAAGSRGTVRTAVGVSLPFEITQFEPDRAWSWRVAGIPATDHHVQRTPEGTRVTFGVPLYATAYLVVCARALERIDAIVTG